MALTSNLRPGPKKPYAPGAVTLVAPVPKTFAYVSGTWWQVWGHVNVTCTRHHHLKVVIVLSALPYVFSVTTQAPMNNRRIPSLVEIATNKCIHNIAKLDDIGQTPFHLVQPILKKMSSKQLNQIEENSLHLIPNSDAIWINLIEKDFPDRPLYQPKNINKKSDELMPNKSLYFQYLKERELFRIDSTKRLRNITEQLKLKKSKNSIVSVSELLRDPTVRKTRNYSYPTNSFRPYRSAAKSSILNKAKRDVQGRSLMFQNSLYNPQKNHDPYLAFNDRPISLRPRHSHNKVLKFSPGKSFTSKFAQQLSLAPPKMGSLHKSKEPAKPPLKTQSKTPSTEVKPNLIPPKPTSQPIPSNEINPTSIITKPGSESQANLDNNPDKPPPKRRKVQLPSIFLSGNRNKRHTLPPKKASSPKSEPEVAPKKLYPIKSSIFHWLRFMISVLP